MSKTSPTPKRIRLDLLFIQRLRADFKTSAFSLEDAARVADEIGFPTNDVVPLLEEIECEEDAATFRMPALAPTASGQALSPLPRVLSTRTPGAPRRSRSTATTPAPFVKWAGGKGSLLNVLLPHIPTTFGRYFEPFVGGGALFWELAPQSAVLADANETLVRAYRGVRDDVEGLIGQLAAYRYDEGCYYQTRAMDVQHLGDTAVAAWMIYLNRTCYNGLWRVNRAGRFNGPFGRHANPTICNPPLLRACSHALATAEIIHGDFEAAVQTALAGDLVYFDPPYAPVSATANFTSYTKEGFTSRDQERLRDCARRLVGRGVRVILSNSTASEIEALYSDREDFEIHRVTAARRMGARGDSRGNVDELVIVGRASDGCSAQLKPCVRTRKP